MRQYAGAVWYRCSFDIPADWRTPDVELAVRFDAVGYRADIWVDGTHVGEHEGGYTPFELDITGALGPNGGSHTLTLRAFDPGLRAACGRWRAAGVGGAAPAGTCFPSASGAVRTAVTARSTARGRAADHRRPVGRPDLGGRSRELKAGACPPAWPGRPDRLAPAPVCAELGWEASDIFPVLVILLMGESQGPR